MSSPPKHARRLALLMPLLAALLMSGLAGCATKGPQGMQATAATVADTAPTPAQDYVIGPGDHLNVSVYDSPQLSMAVPVRPDGRISLPLIPDIQAAGLTPTQLAKEITTRLSQYVKDPNVSVIMTDFSGMADRRVRVIGEAAEPAAFPYSDGMTLLDVMIAAKGLTKFAAGNSATIVRGSGPTQRVIKVRLSDLIKDGDISANIPMQPGDTLIIPQSWF